VDVGVVRALVEHPQVLAQRHQSRVSLTHSMTGMRQARVRGTTHSDRAAHGLPPSLVWSSVTALRPWRLIVALPPGPCWLAVARFRQGFPAPSPVQDFLADVGERWPSRLVGDGGRRLPEIRAQSAHFFCDSQRLPNDCSGFGPSPNGSDYGICAGSRSATIARPDYLLAGSGVGK
jgi:hypothetical protein